MKFFVIVLFFLLFASIVYAPDVVENCVLIKSKDALGSGVKIAQNIVLTVAHLDHGDITVNGLPAKIIKKDEKLDLMLLIVATGDAKVEFANAVIGEEVTVVSYPIGVKMIVFGHVTAVDKDIVCLDINLARGSSGAGVFNKQGQLIGVIQSFIVDADQIVLYTDKQRVELRIIYGRYFIAVSSQAIQRFINEK